MNGDTKNEQAGGRRTSQHVTFRFARCGCEFHYEPELIAANREYYGTKTTAGEGARIKEILGTELGALSFAGDTFTQDFVLHCGDPVERDHKADVSLEFKHEYHDPGTRATCAARLKGFTLLPRADP